MVQGALGLMTMTTLLVTWGALTTWGLVTGIVVGILWSAFVVLSVGWMESD